MVTQSQFVTAYSNHKPNWLIKNFYRYFSSTTVEKDMKVKSDVKIILYISFTLMFISTVVGLTNISKIFLAIYGFTLIPLIILGFIAHAMNNSRIKSICKDLNISLEEYASLVLQYGSLIK